MTHQNYNKINKISRVGNINRKIKHLLWMGLEWIWGLSIILGLFIVIFILVGVVIGGTFLLLKYLFLRDS